jgi:hypothetical protein
MVNVDSSYMEAKIRLVVILRKIFFSLCSFFLSSRAIMMKLFPFCNNDTYMQLFILPFLKKSR